jgi:LysR substrate binding domain
MRRPSEAAAVKSSPVSRLKSQAAMKATSPTLRRYFHQHQAEAGDENEGRQTQNERAHPFCLQLGDVGLEVRIAVSAELIEQLNAGRLDVVFAKRPLGTSKGRLVWREPLVWAAADTFDLVLGAALPLALYRERSVSREAALAALNDNELTWEIVYTSPSLTGVRAAALAGLAITPLPASALIAGLSSRSIRWGEARPSMHGRSTRSPIPPSERALSWCALRHTSASKGGHRLGHGIATRIYPYASAAVGAPQAPASGAARRAPRAGTGVQSFLVW